MFRVSGPGANTVWANLTRNRSLPTPRRTTLVRLRDRDDTLLDEAMAIRFEAPHSFSGEDVFEFHTHGAPSIQKALAEALARFDNVRLATPGEFTRRAFDNGKLDLVQVESLADLISSETKAQRVQALRQLSGELGQLYESWRGRLIRLLANVEAVIDFSEDDGIEEEVISEAVVKARVVAAEMRRHLDDGNRGERIRDGTRVAIVGPPNSGKSSLYNLLLGREAAIVTNVPGTTRDVLEANLDIGGYLIRLTDTAGIHHTDDIVELMGIGRARKEYESADLRALVVDASNEHLTTLLEPFFAQATKPSLVVLNKSDLLMQDGSKLLEQSLGDRFNVPVVSISCVKQQYDALLTHVKESLQSMAPSADTPLLTRIRHRILLQSALESLDAFIAASDASTVELAAEELRLSVSEIAAISGHVTVDDHILGAIFSEFCIGK